MKNTEMLNKLFNTVFSNLDEDTTMDLMAIYEDGNLGENAHWGHVKTFESKLGREIMDQAKLFGFLPAGTSSWQLQGSPEFSVLFSLFRQNFKPEGFSGDLIGVEPTPFQVASHDNQFDFVGGSRQGSLDDVTYSEIISKFGQPTYDEPSSDNKVQVEWDIRFDNGVRATIYDYKQYDVPPEEIDHWSVGGNSSESAFEVYKVMDLI